jgi:MFS family permease
MMAALACVVLGAIDLTVVAAILPGMIGDLGVNTADIDRYIWAVNIYLIAYIVAIPLAGRISDLIGRRVVFGGALIVFLTGSIVCAMSTDLTQLIVGRGIQGFGGGALLPIALALAGDTLGKRAQLAGVGLVSAVETIGWILGPIYGASVVEGLANVKEPWRWVFWINVPVLGVLLLVLWRLPEPVSVDREGGLARLDIPGAILLSLTLTSLNLALATGGELGSGTGTGMRALGGTQNPLADQSGWLIATAVVSLVALAAWELRTRWPLLPVTLYRRGPFVGTVVANLCLGAVIMVAMVNIPVVVALTTDPSNISVASAGLLAPFTVAIAAASLAASAVARRVGELRTMATGVAMSAGGCLLIGSLLDRDRVWMAALGLIVCGVGLGLLLPPLGTLPIHLAGARERGAAASSALLFRLLGMTIGVSTLTSLGVHRLQTLTSRVDPIVRQPDESTASFLIRQQQFIVDHAIPLSIQVVQETFFAAAAIAALAGIPIALLGKYLAAEISAERL